ncbi:glycosyltransferase family 4 protein [Candidatus Dojkabacteria bacterium]|jgi:glycosyltransferase involved in cell wall biosynthesis|nr:glycosyltransferase family 4 protein [Candidatus Dojkabacteria bacterium]
MHIVFLTTEYPLKGTEYGGIAQYTKKTAQQLYKSGHNVSVILSGSKNKLIKDKGVSIIEFKAPNLFEGIDGDTLHQLKRFSRLVSTCVKFNRYVFQINAKHKIDIVQTSNYLFPGLLLLKNKKFPVVCRTSSYAPSLRAMFGAKKTFIKSIEDYFELKTAKDANGLFSPSVFMKRIYEDFENLEAEVIPTIVEDMSNIKLEDSLLKKIKRTFKPKKYILYFGSLSKVKGVDLLVEVIPKIVNKFNNVGFIFLGKDFGIPGKSSMKKFVLTKCNKVKNSILFYPHVRRELLIPIIDSSVCVLVPSRVDNLPNTCLETISRGIPIIGSNRSSVEELIRDKITGFITENSSPTDIYDKIDKMLSMDKNKYSKMKSDVKDYYMDILSEDRLEILVRYYNNVIYKFRHEQA